MSVSNIPLKVRTKLWGTSAGRCHYCNKPLWEDLITKAQYSTAYIAHIYGEKPKSARYHPVLSEKLKHDFSNLMLLCDPHHKLVDIEDVDGHPVERMQEIKRTHEQRIALQTSLDYSHRSHIVHYLARIADEMPIINWQQSKDAMFPNHYPAESNPIEIGLSNSAFQDSEDHYWIMERENLRRQFQTKVRTRLGHDIKHLSVFGFAPQPLLIEFGRLLSDISGVEVYQHQKEPSDQWIWSNECDNNMDFIVHEPKSSGSEVALNLSLSANISNQRIVSVLGSDIAIWTVTLDSPNNDFLKTRSQLQLFRQKFRSLLNRIKIVHGEENIIHVFPATPVAVAIEIGRVWSPKADLPMRIYDQNTQLNGFGHTFDIMNGNEDQI